MRVAWSRGCRGAHSMKHTTLLMLRMLCAMPALAACVPPSTDEELTSETDQAITTNDILARAREWGAAQVPYCGGGRGGGGPGAPGAGDAEQATTTSDILGRAREWVAAQVPSCGGLRGGPDLICGGTCEPPARRA